MWPETWDIGIFHYIIEKSYSEKLAIAAAFIAAEIDRVKRNEIGARGITL
jgi:hypothetical protein